MSRLLGHPVGTPIPEGEGNMNAISKIFSSERDARCVETSKRVRWDIDGDVIRGRRFDAADKFLPEGLSLTDAFTTLSVDEKRFVSQIQGRTYANIFGLVERFINAKVLELSHDHWFGDQVALEALVRFSDEELKHQALFRRIDKMVGEVLPEGYRFDVDPNAVAHAVLGKSTWAVLALTLDIELFTQLHYRQSIVAGLTLRPDVARARSAGRARVDPVREVKGALGRIKTVIGATGLTSDDIEAIALNNHGDWWQALDAVLSAERALGKALALFRSQIPAKTLRSRRGRTGAHNQAVARAMAGAWRELTGHLPAKDNSKFHGLLLAAVATIFGHPAKGPNWESATKTALKRINKDAAGRS
jgi:DNA-binding Lrp family transcriptional regulator